MVGKCDDQSEWSDLKMKLSLARYQSMLTVQYCFLIVDLLINTFSELLRFESVILLVIFVWVPIKIPQTDNLFPFIRIQDVCLVFSLIIVFLSFFSTYVFQVKEMVSQSFRRSWTFLSHHLDQVNCHQYCHRTPAFSCPVEYFIHNIWQDYLIHTFKRNPPPNKFRLNLYVKAGLIGLLVAQFRLPILVAIAYLCLSIAYHVSSLNTRW